MTTIARGSVSLYIDRKTKQWVVRDLEGNFWVVPADEDGWDNRQSFELSDGADLEPIPGHYRYMLHLPF